MIIPELRGPDCNYATKFIAGKFKLPINIAKKGERLWLSFGYNKILLEEVKAMEGAKWHGYDDEPKKQWSIANSLRNHFQISYLEGKNPYESYETPLLDFTTNRELYDHQFDLTKQVITRRYTILASEQGTGKTLAVITAMEWLALMCGVKSWFYVAPKSVLHAVQLEFEKWKAIIWPQFFTYDSLKSIIANWPEGAPAPQAVVYDECSRLKNPMAQRTKTAQHLADSIREEHGFNGAVVLMSGTPAPKTPLDWWSLCNIACPGFIKEGTLQKFQKRLAFLKEGQSQAGGTFIQVSGWRDDEKKCETCGKSEDDPLHDSILMMEAGFHQYKPSTNEVAKLYRRMNGLVMVKFKKDCLSLPEKQYRVIRLKPTQSIINSAKIISAHGGSAIRTLTLLRELSDGFQYDNTAIGEEDCPRCKGSKTVEDWTYIGPEEEYEKIQQDQLEGKDIPSTYFEKREVACPYCDGTGRVTKYVREAVQVPCPKEDALTDLLDEFSDVGRFVIYAGFTGSIDRCVQSCLKNDWNVIRVDGRGWWSNQTGQPKELLKRFQYEKSVNNLAFIGHPASAGMGLTLTASPATLFYSNDFNAESRWQAVDRIHRPGMDVNRGATIIDLIHLPSDEYVLKNLMNKKRLQDITMGDFKAQMNEVFK